MNSKKKQDWLDAFEARMKQQQAEDEHTFGAQGGRQQAANGGTDFMGEVERVMAEKKCGRGAAVKIVIAKNPTLHSDWLESQNK